VIIPTKNEGNYIRDTLLSIKRQYYKNIEIIVVDSSDDGTVSIVKEFTDKIIKKNVNIPQAKNLGAKHTKGKFLVFLDADTILLPSWIGKSLKYLINGKYDVVIGNVSTREKDYRAYLVGGIYRSFLELTGLINNFSMGGIPFIIRKKLFKKSYGFRENFASCEDIEFLKRLKKCGKVKVDKKILSLISMRRFEKKGYLKEIWDESKSGLHFLTRNRPLYIDSYPIFR